MPRKPRAEEEGTPVSSYVRATPVGVPVRTLESGSIFTYRGEDFRLTGVAGGVATVHLLEDYEIEYAPGEFKTAQQGVAQLEMPVDTIVQPQ